MYTCIWIHIKCHFYTIHPWCYFHQLRLNPAWGTTEPYSCCPWAAPRCSEACQDESSQNPIIISISKGGIHDNFPIWVCLKMVSTPLYPMVLLILIPMKNGCNWEYTQHFQTNPYFPDVQLFYLCWGGCKILCIPLCTYHMSGIVRLWYFEKSDHCHCKIQAWHLQSHPNFQILNCRVKSETSNMLGMEKPAKKEVSVKLWGGSHLLRLTYGLEVS